MSKSKAKSAAKSKPIAKTKIAKRVEAAPLVAEPVVTTAADVPAAVVAAPASKARRFAKAEGAVEQNGIRQPGVGTACRAVWDVLDKLRAEGKDTTFEAVRELAGSGMADATIRTQRQRHREFHGLKREAKKPARKPAAAKQAAPAVVSEEAQQQSA
jgi:hypothetical protein